MPKTRGRVLKRRPIKKPSKKLPPKRLSYEELYNIVVAIGVTALIFAYNYQNPIATFDAIPRALFAVSIALLFHLLAQKLLARRLGVAAFYRLWFPGLIVSMLLMLVGIKIVLVGAVMLSAYKFSRFGYKSRYMSMTEIGWVGVSGPLANILLATIFKFVTPFSYLVFINALIALFTLIPIKPLDGSKVFLWNPILWLLLIFAIVLILTPSGILNYFTFLYGAPSV